MVEGEFNLNWRFKYNNYAKPVRKCIVKGTMKKLDILIIAAIMTLMIGCAALLSVKAQSYAPRAAGQPQDGLDENVKASPYVKDGINSAESIPEIPAPPAVSLPPVAAIENKFYMSSNWRCRALALANEYPLKKNSIAWTMPVTYKQGQALLKQAIVQMGWILQSEYNDAGQFLISLPESSKKNDIIVISQPVGESNILFKMHIYTDRQIDINRINALSEAMKNLQDNRGLLQ
jgi:hypothetical protein